MLWSSLKGSDSTGDAIGNAGSCSNSAVRVSDVPDEAVPVLTLVSKIIKAAGQRIQVNLGLLSSVEENPVAS